MKIYSLADRTSRFLEALSVERGLSALPFISLHVLQYDDALSSQQKMKTLENCSYYRDRRKQ